MNIADIFVYPIKSLRGCAVDVALVCGYGLQYDRLCMLVDHESKMLTQRDYPHLAAMIPRIVDGRVRIALPSGWEFSFPHGVDAWTDERVTVNVWGHEYVGAVATVAINMAFTGAVGVDCRLVSILSDVYRTRQEVAFHDDSPLLVISQASLDELNHRLATPVPMDRFRPNLVITDAKPFEEDLWHRIAIGDTMLRAVKPCERCVTTTVDQESGEFTGPEPLKTLATFRRKRENVAFGQYYRPESKGTKLHRGDEVRVLELKPEAAAHLAG